MKIYLYYSNLAAYYFNFNLIHSQSMFTAGGGGGHLLDSRVADKRKGEVHEG